MASASSKKNETTTTMEAGLGPNCIPVYFFRGSDEIKIDISFEGNNGNETINQTIHRLVNEHQMADGDYCLVSVSQTNEERVLDDEKNAAKAIADELSGDKKVLRLIKRSQVGHSTESRATACKVNVKPPRDAAQ